jgi:hypothetical protein
MKGTRYSAILKYFTTIFPAAGHQTRHLDNITQVYDLNCDIDVVNKKFMKFTKLTSCSASSISLRPKSAREISATL